MTKTRYYLLVFFGMLLFAGIGISIFAALQEEAEVPWKPLALRIPLRIHGWVGQECPLGETEAVRNAVEKLNYDDYIYRVYRKGNQEVFVYAMFWRQGRISVREMSGHTPDGCWVANGARNQASVANCQYVIATKTAKPAEVRQFLFPPNDIVNVAWWHLWGGEPVDQNYAKKSALPMLSEIWRWLGQYRGKKKDQLLVRIHSRMSLDEAMRTEPVRTFLEELPDVFACQVPNTID